MNQTTASFWKVVIIVKRKKRRKRRGQHKVITRGYHSNMHHCLWRRSDWNWGYGRLLRNVFVFQVDEWTHNMLHNTVLGNVPRPPERVLKAAWEDYLSEKSTVDKMKLLTALSWLMTHIHDDECRGALAKQYCFFALNGGW